MYPRFDLSIFIRPRFDQFKQPEIEIDPNSHVLEIGPCDGDTAWFENFPKAFNPHDEKIWGWDWMQFNRIVVDIKR